MANQVIMGRLLTTDMSPYIDEDAMQIIEKDWPGVRDSMALSKYNLRKFLSTPHQRRCKRYCCLDRRRA